MLTSYRFVYYNIHIIFVFLYHRIYAHVFFSCRSECSLCSCPRNKREIKWYLYDEPAKKMKLNSAHMEMGDDVDQVKSQLNNIQIGIPRELFLEQATVHPLTFHRISESIDENISILPREKVTGKKRSLYQVTNY